MKRVYALILSTAAAGLMLSSAACTPSGSVSTGDGGTELLKNKCTVCHTVDRIDQAKKDRAGWEETVTRMRAAGAVLTDEEAAQIVDYLAERDAGK